MRARGDSAVDLLVRARARQGWARVRRAAGPVLLAGLAAAIAYAVARYAVGHELPLFAPVAAWVALGFTADRDLRRVAEMAAGVAVGVLAGDLLVHVIGSGPAQVGAVLVIAVLVARLLDRGDLLAVQAGVQAVAVVVLPASLSGGPVGRWVDAVVGGLTALAVAALSPQDPRRRPRGVAEEAMTELAGMLTSLADGLRTADAAQVRRSLLRGRASQAVLDTWASAATSARQLARVSPAFRRHRDELAALTAAATHADRAMRNARVLSRRAQVAVEAGTDTERLARLADVVALVAWAAADGGAALGAGLPPTAARTALARAGAAVDPYVLAPGDLQAQGLVLLLRSLVVDVAETLGVEPEDARDLLADL